MWLTSVKLQIYDQMNNYRIFLFYWVSVLCKKGSKQHKQYSKLPLLRNCSLLVGQHNTTLHCSLCQGYTFTKSTHFSEVSANMLSFTLLERLIQANLLKSYLSAICFAPFLFFIRITCKIPRSTLYNLIILLLIFLHNVTHYRNPVAHMRNQITIQRIQQLEKTHLSVSCTLVWFL